jgi:hypothetical protein
LHVVLKKILLFQPTFPDAEMSEKDLGLSPVNMVSCQVLKVSSEPDLSDRTAKHVGRIANIEGRLRDLKLQTTIAMGQAEKSVTFSQKSVFFRKSNVCLDGQSCSTRRV